MRGNKPLVHGGRVPSRATSRSTTSGPVLPSVRMVARPSWHASRVSATMETVDSPSSVAPSWPVSVSLLDADHVVVGFAVDELVERVDPGLRGLRVDGEHVARVGLGDLLSPQG